MRPCHHTTQLLVFNGNRDIPNAAAPLQQKAMEEKVAQRAEDRRRVRRLALEQKKEHEYKAKEEELRKEQERMLANQQEVRKHRMRMTPSMLSPHLTHFSAESRS